MAYKRKFGKRYYNYDSAHFGESKAIQRANELRLIGFLVRITKGNTFLTHSVYFQVWKYKSNFSGDNAS